MTNRVLKFLRLEAEPYLRSRSKKPWGRQLREMRALWQRYHCPPYHYFKHRLYEREARAGVLDYIPPELVGRYQRFANPKEKLTLLADKRETCRALAAARIPCVADLFSVSRSGQVMDGAGRAIPVDLAAAQLRERGGSVFVKPIDGGVGNGASARLAGEVADELFTTARHVIIQPVLHNHPLLARLFPHSLNTVRLDTLLDGDRCFITGACLKLGTGRSQVDNWAKGAIAVGIDMMTGALASSGIRKAAFGRTTHTVHPDTGVRFEGVSIPYWPDIVKLAERAAFALSPHVTLGWDIAVTPDGPVAIEANQTGDFFLLQEACGPLGRTALARKAIRHWEQLKGISIGSDSSARFGPAAN